MALQQGISWFRRQNAPITLGILASFIVMAFVWWFAKMEGMENAALTSSWQQQPWTFLTYPWAMMPFTGGLQIVCFVFLCMWVFMTGSQVESDLGAKKYIGVWIAMILLPALFNVFLGPLVSKQILLMGVWLPEAALTIIWCTRNPNHRIMLYGIIPLTGKILGFVTLAITIILSGLGNPLLGVICALHLPIAWAFAANKLPVLTYSRGASFGGGRSKVKDNQFLKKNERMDSSYFDDVKKREKDREERERLRKLFESSLNDDTGTDR